MPFFEAPKSFRLRQFAVDTTSSLLSKRSSTVASQVPFVMAGAAANTTCSTFETSIGVAGSGSQHPDFIHLAGLVCEAVLEVVFVALPGYLVAWTGMFDTNSQKFVAELNTLVFTPCLIFVKLASQLNADRLSELAIIPAIFIVQTFVSWLCATVMSYVFGFSKMKRQKNFILAMGVFGNSNSLPISLVLSLSQTINGLHWDKIPGDNDDEVGARGILYLLIFQQLGQLLRWTWGYSVLLKPKEAYEEEEARQAARPNGLAEEGHYTDNPDDADDPIKDNGPIDSGFGSRSRTPESESTDLIGAPIMPTPTNGNNIATTPLNVVASYNSSNNYHNRIDEGDDTDDTLGPQTPDLVLHKTTTPTPAWKVPIYACGNKISRAQRRTNSILATFFRNLWRSLPRFIQKPIAFLHYYNSRFWAGVWRQMNPPLWAMLAALIVASVPALQDLFFSPGTLISNSVTSGIRQNAGVAVPLILVVLGANLARSTLPKDQIATTKAEKAEERRLLLAAILSRMLLPTVIMAPLLALAAKYVPVSILDDPIFIIVCFLLTGAPSALQLAQICQINNVFMGAMSALLVWSYVVAIFPSTLMLVLLALEVVQWAVL